MIHFLQYILFIYLFIYLFIFEKLQKTLTDDDEYKLPDAAREHLNILKSLSDLDSLRDLMNSYSDVMKNPVEGAGRALFDLAHLLPNSEVRPSDDC
jgi:hypothetical protein